MCTVSMIYDYYNDKWRKKLDEAIPPFPLIPYQPPPQISSSEIEEFRQLLEKARQYDVAHNEPNCELEEKKTRLIKLAEELGVKIDFPEGEIVKQPNEKT